MEKMYDVIVVGAGNGGLAAAANTASEGLKTLLLEKHNIPGGCATSFRRGRFEFEPSLHELCSVGTAEHPDSVYKVFDSLGAKINWRYEHDIFRVINKQKGLVVHPANGNPDGTLVNAIMNICKDSLSGIGGELRPGIVHRLDKDTSRVNYCC